MLGVGSASTLITPKAGTLFHADSHAVAAEIDWLCSCRVGWLSLTPTIRTMLAAAATKKCFFGSALHRA